MTDKAVSKWERDLFFPDINSIPKLAEIFEVSVDDLM
ncbi:helix-turn-helix domain-containing protein [Streptococcus mutans]|nr:helix-turn-helix domain-containing protein [Streptococcus mutans]